MLEWRVARLIGDRRETATARTLLLEAELWPGHLPGQHVDLRLTAEDGYSTQRSYSLAAPPAGTRLELTVERLADGEVSPYLTEDFAPGDSIELRGPVGGWFVWEPSWPAPVLLVGGGSGVVPLMAMLRSHREAGSAAAMCLLYSVRTPDDVYYRRELQAVDDADVDVVYTRRAPDGHGRPAGRIAAADLSRPAWLPDKRPRCYVCGSTGFVETVTQLLVGLGHDPARIRTERFGSTGGSDG
jgi:ferredoxin-NADP reductase